MSANSWLATGNFNTNYKQEQKTFFTSLDRSIFSLFLVILFSWPLLFPLSNKYMFVIDNILIAIVAVMGLNLVTGFAGLISIGHAAFVGIGAYTVASFCTVIGYNHIVVTHFWPVLIIILFAILAVLAIAAKVIGCGIGAKLSGFTSSSSLAGGAAMCGRGALELVLLSYGHDIFILTDEQFSAVVLVTLMTILVTPIIYSKTLHRAERIESEAEMQEQPSTPNS